MCMTAFDGARTTCHWSWPSSPNDSKRLHHFSPSPEFLVSRTSAHPFVRRLIESMAYPASLFAGRGVVLLKICQHPSAASINVRIDDHIQATPSTGHSRSPSAQPSLRRPIDSKAYPASPRANRDVVHLKICQHPSVASINVLIDDHIQKGQYPLATHETTTTLFPTTLSIV